MKKWSGQLPRRNYKNPSYSTKVFLGGVPWDITEGNYYNLLLKRVGKNVSDIFVNVRHKDGVFEMITLHLQ